MLGTFRKVSQSWFAKGFFALLVLLFVGWGIGPELNMRLSNQPAIKVGDVQMSPEEVANEVRRQAESVQRQYGGKIPIDQVRHAILGRTVEQMIAQALLDQEGKNLGLAVADATVRKVVGEIPAFRNQTGNFDPAIYRQALQANGFTEARFETSERKEILRSELSDMVTQGAVAPEVMAQAMFRYRYEQRVADLIAFDAAAMPAPAAPEQTVLEAYHKDHAADFTAPERRNLIAIVLRADDTVADFKPGDDQIQKAYQDQQDAFTIPESRHLQQVFFPAKDAAQKLVDAVKGGTSFADAAKAAGKEVDDLGTIDKKGLPIPILADAAFALAKPGVTDPVQTPLGFNVVNVVAITPGSVKPLAEVRDQIVAGLKKTEALTRVNALSNKLEDGIGGGATLEEVAGNLKLPLIKLAGVDRDGHGPDGKPVAQEPDSAAFRQAAFTAEKGGVSDVIALEDESGYAVVRVDDVIAPALKPFDTVKDQVLAAWSKEQQLAEAKKAAADAVAALNKGEPADKVAGKNKLTTTKPFTREGGEDAPAPVAATAFKLKVGQADDVTLDQTAYAVRLAAITPADPQLQAPQLADLRERIARSIGGDLDQQFVNGLQKQIGVRVRTDLIEAQFSQAQ